MKTHDEQYIQYLQTMFGTASISFFGVLVSIITLILICIVLLLNSTMVFITPQITTGINLPTKKPIIV